MNGECVAARAEAAIVYSSSDGGERLIQAITFKTLFEIFCPRHRASISKVLERAAIAQDEEVAHALREMLEVTHG